MWSLFHKFFTAAVSDFWVFTSLKIQNQKKKSLRVLCFVISFQQRVDSHVPSLIAFVSCVFGSGNQNRLSSKNIHIPPWSCINVRPLYYSYRPSTTIEEPAAPFNYIISLYHRKYIFNRSLTVLDKMYGDDELIEFCNSFRTVLFSCIAIFVVLKWFASVSETVSYRRRGDSVCRILRFMYIWYHSSILFFFFVFWIEWWMFESVPIVSKCPFVCVWCIFICSIIN